ncbi:MAG: lysophospholipid acyltransferase family protein [Candidatus Hydrothermia bacterium]
MLVTLIGQIVAFFIPEKIAIFIARILADAFRVFDWRSKAVQKNLEVIFPHMKHGERKRIMRDTFRKMFISYIRVMKCTREKWRRMVVIEDLELFRGKKSIVYSIHLGPWDIPAKFINNFGFNFYALMENLPKFYLWMWLRFRRGIKVFLVGHGTIKALQKLKREENYSLVVLVDRVTSGKYTVKKFLGEKVIFADGLFKLPKLVEGTPYFLTCHWDESMQKIRFDIVELDINHLESQILKYFEESVKRYPDQWFNFYFFTTQKRI